MKILGIFNSPDYYYDVVQVNWEYLLSMFVLDFDDLIVVQFMVIFLHVLVDLWVVLIPVERGFIDLLVIFLF